MTGPEFIAAFLAAGSLRGLRPGSAVADADLALPVDFIEEEGAGGSLRRDYGLVELYFSGEPDPVLTGGSLELHRLPGDPALAAEWSSATGVDVAPYTAWSEVEGALAAAGLAAVALECTTQGDYLECRNPDTKVSVLVVDGEDERDDWPGHGDLWSVSLG
ncbi:hypothetical protein [Streptomyces sp. AP-93]|uniref:hypothetical protein n=1 Tax=Streptomyces sp. AP-93 TaxID=2929048 RepID=UPI001FAFA9E2|nr:hypothetical protein [Streptomyces sp. AP-93]MCJ0869130.1 hypothetical protein [Streptomyces sp. AP-93]